MKKKSFTKRIMLFALTLVMAIGMMPASAFAATTSFRGAEGHVLEEVATFTFTDGYDSTIFIYATPQAYDLPYTTYTLREFGGNFGVPEYDSEQWYFAGWKTWYTGSHSGMGIVVSDKANPEYDDDSYYFTSHGYDAVGYPLGYMSVLKETLWDGTYYLSAIYEPIVTVNAQTGVSYTVPGSTKHADNKYSTQYNTGMTIDYSANDGYVITGVSANYGTSYSNDGNTVSITNVTRPATININAKLKQQNVTFNANGGNGTMTNQAFEHSSAQALTANEFTKIGYTFAGWNTVADGSGTSYADKQSVTFTPVNDGDSITLYAQWTECNNHIWNDGKCSECGIFCSHSGGNATCTEQAVCEICSEKYGSLADKNHAFVYSASGHVVTEACGNGCNHNATATIEQDMTIATVYAGSAIEALKVSYSDNWQGGVLAIAYSNNASAGTASGTIEKDGAMATATFEITEATPNPGGDPGTPGSDSTENTKDKSSISESVLPPTGDATFSTVALIVTVIVVGSALGFVAIRKQA